MPSDIVTLAIVVFSASPTGRNPDGSNLDADAGAMSSPTAAGGGSTSPPARRGNPLAFLGLRRVGQEDDEDEEAAKPRLPGSPSKGGVELNRRGLPARKRKRNSLIYGTDDLVSIPVKSPRKKGSAPATPKRNSNVIKRGPAESDGEDGPTPEEDEDGGRRTPSPPPKSPAARKTRQTGCLTVNPPCDGGHSLGGN